MNIKLKTGAKKQFCKIFFFFKLMNNAVFGKTIENAKKHRDIKLVKTERRRSCLAIFHTTKFFTENLLATEMKKTQI